MDDFAKSKQCLVEGADVLSCGHVIECSVAPEPTAGGVRFVVGFGFVTFSDPASVDKVLANGPHELDGKKIDPKIAFPKRAHPKEGPPETLALQVALDSNVNSYLAYASVFEEMVTRTKKVFVGGLSAPTTLEDVKNYFQQFGRIEDAMLMFDKQTNRHRVVITVAHHWRCDHVLLTKSSLLDETSLDVKYKIAVDEPFMDGMGR
ncbi:RNA-binding protein Musashi homolog Rbp6 isoform X10 [Ixodes scapularis]